MTIKNFSELNADIHPDQPASWTDVQLSDLIESIDAGAVNGGIGGSSEQAGIKVWEEVLTDADILAMDDLAGPFLFANGPTQKIEVFGVYMSADCRNGAYTNPGGGEFYLAFVGLGPSTDNFDPAFMVGHTTRKAKYFPITETDLYPLGNDLLLAGGHPGNELQLYKETAALEGGGDGNTLLIRILYFDAPRAGGS